MLVNHHLFSLQGRDQALAIQYRHTSSSFKPAGKPGTPAQKPRFPPEAGTYTVRIDRLVGSFTVGEAGLAAVWWAIIGLVSALVLLGFFSLAVWRRRRRREGVPLPL